MIITVILWNIFVFLLYGFDKLSAIKKWQRISEKTLLTCSFSLGGVGAILGMNIFRHKTKHLKFTILVPVSCVLTLVIISYSIKF